MEGFRGRIKSPSIQSIIGRRAAAAAAKKGIGEEERREGVHHLPLRYEIVGVVVIVLLLALVRLLSHRRRLVPSRWSRCSAAEESECVGGEGSRTREDEEDEKSLPCSDRMRSRSVFSSCKFSPDVGNAEMGTLEIEIEPWPLRPP